MWELMSGAEIHEVEEGGMYLRIWPWLNQKVYRVHCSQLDGSSNMNVMDKSMKFISKKKDNFGIILLQKLRWMDQWNSLLIPHV